MRILYIGCVKSSYRELKLLIEHKKNVVGVITKSESKFNSDFCDISSLILEAAGLDKLNRSDLIMFIKKYFAEIL